MKETEKLLNEAGICLPREVLSLLILAGLPDKFFVLVQMLEAKKNLTIVDIEENLDRAVVNEQYQDEASCNTADNQIKDRKRFRGPDQEIRC